MSEHHIFYHGVDRGNNEPETFSEAVADLASGLALLGGVLYLMVAIPGVAFHTLDAWASDKPGSPVVHGLTTVADHTAKASVFAVQLTAVVGDNLVNGESTFTKDW